MQTYWESSARRSNPDIIQKIIAGVRPTKHGYLLIEVRGHSNEEAFTVELEVTNAVGSMGRMQSVSRRVALEIRVREPGEIHPGKKGPRSTGKEIRKTRKQNSDRPRTQPARNEVRCCSHRPGRS